MKVTLIPGRELSDDLVHAWIGLQQANPDLASPYFHPEFTKVIAAVRDDVEIAVLESGGKIATFFPFQREYEMVGRPVGGVISDYHGLICRPEFRFSPRDLLRYSQLVTWDFDHLVASQLSFAPFQWSIEPSPQIDLSHGYADYVQERRKAGSEQIKKIYNLIRRVEREIGPLQLILDSTDEVALATVLGWKSAQYRQSGAHDLFAPGWIRDAVDRIFTMHADGCMGVLSLLYAGDRLLAGHFGMRSHKVWHYWFPSYDPEVGKYSPGLILLLKMAEQASAVGVRTIDLGKGMSPYKQRLMNSSSPLATGRLEVHSWRSFRRRTWHRVRSELVKSPLAPPARVVLEWLRRRGGDVRLERVNSERCFRTTGK